jgi:2-hydroxychromene-2-carboxylate isomerase
LVNRHVDVAARLEWIPFWEPDEWSERLLTEAGGQFIYTPMPRAKHLYILHDVRRLAAQRALTVSWPVDRSPCWEVPHLGYLVAARYGRGHEFIQCVYHARWQDGRDICDRNTVADVAQDLGLDPNELANAADDPDARVEGVQMLLASHRDGVFGVPFFVNRFDKYWGIDRLEAFVTSLRESPDASWSRANPNRGPEFAVQALAWAAFGDGGHAGGCG